MSLLNLFNLRIINHITNFYYYPKKMKIYKYLTIMVIAILAGMTVTSCSNDEPKNVSIVGTWYLNDSYEEDGYKESLSMTLKFNSDHTGSITETWISESRASSNETYKMNFSWATSTDSSGNEILKVSYISGDKDTELFYGNTSTALWTRQFVLTGNILNIYDASGSGVWVFKRK